MKEYFNNIYTESKEKFFNSLTKDLNNKVKRFIVTVNPESVMIAQKSKEMSSILLNKNYTLVADGISIIKKAKKYNLTFKDRITGIDIATFLLEELNRTKKSLYLFGSKQEVLDDLVAKIKKEYPNIVLLGYTNGYVKDKDKVFKTIIDLRPDVCLVALGIPMQELLINKYFSKVKKGIYIGVGGSFDVLSGQKKRAPKFFINHNLEWLYRIIKEPKRLKRFCKNNILFLFKR